METHGWLSGKADVFVVLRRQLATTHLVGRYARYVGKDTARQLVGRHLEREEADHGAFIRLHLAVRSRRAADVLGGVVGDVGRERGFAHRGTRREDYKVRLVQATQLAVEFGKTRRHARDLAIPLEGGGGGLDRRRQRRVEGPEACAPAPRSASENSLRSAS